MYLELFKLNELPFRLSPDPQFLYLSKQHARAKAYMESTIWFTDGFVVITGEIGAGKTTLIETFLHELQSDVIVAHVNQTQLSPTAFLQTVLVQFGFKPFAMKKPEVLATLNEFLVEQQSNGRKVLLIVDEAQNLSNRVLEEVRMLSGIETTKEKALRIILAGQPELNEKLNSPELVQLAQRVRLRFHLSALSSAETNSYIDHRLEVAGSQGRRIFAEEIYPTIFKYTAGTPRLINTLCDTAMMAAFGNDRDTVTSADLEAAIGELQWVEHSSTTNRMRTPDIDGVSVASNGPNGPNAPHGPNGPAEPAGTGPVVGRILIAHEGKTIMERDLKPGRIVIGRTPDNDLQIDSKFISRHHCQIIVQGDSCVIEDLNSTNGIYVHSKRMRRHHLNDGDVVHVGRHEVMFLDERIQRLRPAADLTDTEVVEKT
jgi:type II secretory pathway predicted ATPase ExeA